MSLKQIGLDSPEGGLDSDGFPYCIADLDWIWTRLGLDLDSEILRKQDMDRIWIAGKPNGLDSDWIIKNRTRLSVCLIQTDRLDNPVCLSVWIILSVRLSNPQTDWIIQSVCLSSLQ